MIDSLKMSSGDLTVSVRCALCNEPVQTGTTHICKVKESNDENTEE